MRLTCPCCGASLPLEALLADGCAREVMAIALKLPGEIGDRVLRYLALFRASGRGLAWDRAKRLLAELAEPIAAGQVERHGRVWPAPLDYWKSALDEMLEARDRDRLQLPLKTHGYLFEIVCGLSSRSEARRETAREVAARDGRPEGRRPSLTAAAAASPAAAPPSVQDTQNPTVHVRQPMPEHIGAELSKLGLLQRALKEPFNGP
jgi:hypothetical protein